MKTLQESIIQTRHLFSETMEILSSLEKDLSEGKHSLHIFERVQQLRNKSGAANHEVVEMLLLSFENHKSNHKKNE